MFGVFTVLHTPLVYPTHLEPLLHYDGRKRAVSSLVATVARVFRRVTMEAVVSDVDGSDGLRTDRISLHPWANGHVDGKRDGDCHCTLLLDDFLRS